MKLTLKSLEKRVKYLEYEKEWEDYVKKLTPWHYNINFETSEKTKKPQHFHDGIPCWGGVCKIAKFLKK